MEVHVIRHTPVAFDNNRCYGRLDVPVADSFEQDIERVKRQLSPPYDVVYTSPSKRCTQLADALKLNSPIRKEASLMELNFGSWEGKQWSEIDQDQLNAWMDDFVHIAPEDGESLTQMYTRIAHFLDQLRREPFQKALIITHAGTIRCFWAYLLQFPLENTFKIPVGFFEQFACNLGKERAYDSILQLR